MSNLDSAASPHATFDLRTESAARTYKLLASSILPRPIAWITTVDAAGVPNAAPFSFFNVLSSDPPLIAVGFSAAPDREGKDTLANILSTGELVVNTVPEELAEAMNVTSANMPRGMDELPVAGLATAPSVQVRAPRIAAAPVSMECVTWQVLQPGASSTILLARVVQVHVRRDALEDEAALHLDPAQMRLIGRMHGGGGYCRTRDLFTLGRPTWPPAEEEADGRGRVSTI